MKSINKNRIWIALMFCVATQANTGCKKLIEVNLPIDKNTSENVFRDKNTAIGAISAIYAQLNSGTGPNHYTGNLGMSIRSGLLADELVPINTQQNPEYLFAYNPKAGWSTWWISAYRDYIYGLNSAIEGLEKSTSISNSAKNILIGEAKFTRSWLYFNLLNYYGDVPIVINTDFRLNSNISRSPKDAVYSQIVSDLLDAELKLTDTYLGKDLINSTEDRIRPNRKAASALLARVYLYMGRWAEAENEASKIIGNPNFELLTDINSVFLKHSKETIWAMQPNMLDLNTKNTPDAKFLLSRSTNANLDPLYYLSPYLLAVFEPGDLRKSNWTRKRPSGMIVSCKYKEGVGSTTQLEYTIVLRLAEQYLIRAEARARQGKLTGEQSALSDINSIRRRANVPDFFNPTFGEIMKAIGLERQRELFLEWGDRWLTLKRSGTATEVMTSIPEKVSSWTEYKQLLPVPHEEFTYNPALRGHQNPGYTEE